MTPKEKAKYLFNMFEYLVMSDSDGSAHKGKQKECAIKAVDEILKNSYMNYSGADISDNEILSDTEYWDEVKKEIELL